MPFSLIETEGIRTACQHRYHRWERVHDQGKQCPHEQNNVCEEPDGTEPERPVTDVVPAADEEADDRNGVRDV